MAYPPCSCGADDDGDGAGVCDMAEFGYPWCRRCHDHHRHPETCPGIKPDGSLADYRFEGDLP